MRCASWNVNGLRACCKRGFTDWLGSAGVDLALVQETKCHEDALPDELRVVGDHRLRLHHAVKPGYSGVGIYHRDEPDEWIEGLGEPAFDDEGRFLAARYGRSLIASVYFPNSRPLGARLDYRLAFGQHLRDRLRAWRRRRWNVLLGGDFNVAHEEIDIARPKQNEKNPGFLPAEREWMTAFLKDGYVDTWRAEHPGEVGYTWWTQRFPSARAKNLGWRLDYFCADRSLAPRVRNSVIRQEVLGSDHCPILLEFDPA